MMKKMMLPMLIAYKLKFFTLVPIFVGKALIHLLNMIMKNLSNVAFYMFIRMSAMQLRMLLALRTAMRVM
jgi:hypothetical protein